MINFNKAYYVFKWLPSENASSKITKDNAKKIRKYLHLSAKEYRQILSKGREHERILERLMSAGEWDKIDFSNRVNISLDNLKIYELLNDCGFSF